MRVLDDFAVLYQCERPHRGIDIETPVAYPTARQSPAWSASTGRLAGP
jgi:hypothetical protein